MKNNFKEILKEYCNFLKMKKLWSKNNLINYEFQIEKLYDWKSQQVTKNLMKWFLGEQKKNTSKISIVHLNKISYIYQMIYYIFLNYIIYILICTSF